MMHELGRPSEVSGPEQPEKSGFREIKPESGMTFEEAKEFVTKQFADVFGKSPDKGPSVERENSETCPEHVKCRNEELEGQRHPETGVPFERRVIDVLGKWLEVVVPRFDSKFDAQLPKDMLCASDDVQSRECSTQLKEAVANDPEVRSRFSADQLAQIEDGGTPDGYTWHHDAEVGKMQLVDTEIHEKTGHTGGRSFWGGGAQNR